MMAYLLNKLNTGSQIHSKVYYLPVYPFLSVHFLFEHKHLMVEELLQFFIGEVDAQLLQAIELIQNNQSMNHFAIHLSC